MGEYSEIIRHLIYFGVFVMAIILIAAIVLSVFTKKFSFSTSKSKLYGILFNLSNKGVIAVSLTTIVYLFLVWCALSMPALNYVYASLLILVPITSSIIVGDYIKIPMNIIVSFVNCFAIYIMHFVHTYLSGEIEDIYMRIAIFFIVAFAFIYFTYNYINDINEIVKTDKERKVGDQSAA